jgi:hypothetical protein
VTDRNDEPEVVDAVPVEEPRAAHPPAPAPQGGALTVAPVAAQAAAVAVTGFAAGAAAVAVVRRARTRKTLRRNRKALKGLEVRGTRSFLVDITLLGGRD